MFCGFVYHYSMPVFYGVIFFVAGIAMGSFLNVLSLRYNPEAAIFAKKVVGGRSHCRNCAKTLTPFELIPVLSFLIQRGKCRNCSARLLWQYPIVEFLTGVYFATVPFFFSGFYKFFPALAFGTTAFWMMVFLWLLIGSALILLAAIDVRLTIIPDQITLFLLVLGIFVTGLQNGLGVFGSFSGSFLGSGAAIFGIRNNIWMNHLFAAFIGFVAFGIVWGLTRGRGMGFGDVKLAGALGMILGWPDILGALLLAVISGAIVGLLLIALKRKKFKEGVPFGPFLVWGLFLILFFGKTILLGYFSVFGL